jgi:lipopolysaccharide export system protein LptA
LLTAAALLLAATSMGAPARAQSLDLTQGGPVEITSVDGIEWRQQEQVVIARGDARAARGGVVLEADRLMARYRDRGGAATTTAPQASSPPARRPEEPMAGGEIWRLEAEGRVRITTATERAEGQRAVYDMDQAVMVLSGGGLQLTTPDQRITARDSLEYWPQRRMAVARGGAVVTTADNRRITADTLVAYFLEDPAGGSRPATAAAAPRPAPAAPTTATPGRPVPGADGKIDRVEAYGEVEIRTEQEVVRGERGIYSPVTGMARLLGNVRITRGENQLNGQEAIVNLRTGVSRLVSAPGQRVQGLVVPQQQQPTPAQVPNPQVPAQAPARQGAQQGRGQ